MKKQIFLLMIISIAIFSSCISLATENVEDSNGYFVTDENGIINIK